MFSLLCRDTNQLHTDSTTQIMLETANQNKVTINELRLIIFYFMQGSGQIRDCGDNIIFSILLWNIFTWSLPLNSYRFIWLMEF